MDINATKSRFISFLMKHDMFGTLALMGMTEVRVSGDIPAPACILLKDGMVPTVTIHPKVLEMDKFLEPEMSAGPARDYLFKITNILYYHELRHTSQMADLGGKPWTRLTYPPDIVTDEQMQWVAKSVLNMGMDMALNEDMQKLFPDIKEKTGRLMEYFYDKPGAQGCFVPDDWERNKDWIYYSNKIIELWNQGKNLDGSDADKDQPPSRGQDQVDSHDFQDGDGEEKCPSDGTGEWRRIWDRACAEGKVIGNQIGRQAGDYSLELGNDKLQKHIEDAIRKVKTRVMRILTPHVDTSYSWSQINKLYPSMHLPGKMKVPRTVPKVVVVLDVSGSMCSSEILNQLRPAVALLEKRKLLAKAYTCDTELAPLTSVVKGGGGTIFNNDHVQQIKKDLGKSGKVAIVYITDEYVDLNEINKNDDVELHVINVHGTRQ